MAKLYEINQEIEACIDTETGEILDYERLNALQIEREEKIQGVALAVKNLLSDANAISQEVTTLAEREAKCRKKAESLKGWLAYVLAGEKFSTAKCTVSFRKSTAVSITDAEAIPEEFVKIETTKSPNKAAIKKALQNGGFVAGCTLVENLNTQIK
jgi:hypothetical protein